MIAVAPVRENVPFHLKDTKMVKKGVWDNKTDESITKQG
jgi:hypothetical protein